MSKKKWSGPSVLVLCLALVFLVFLALLTALALGSEWDYPRFWPGGHNADIPYLLSAESKIWQGLWLSTSVALVVGALSTLLALLITRYLHSEPILRWAYLPFLVSPVILATSWQYFFTLFSLSGDSAGVAIALLLICVPYGVIFCRDFWTEEVVQFQAMILNMGGTEWDYWRLVVWPMGRSFFSVCFFQCFLISWFDYGLTALIGYGKVGTLTLLVFDFAQSSDIHLAALASLCLMVPPMLILLVSRNSLVRKF